MCTLEPDEKPGFSEGEPPDEDPAGSHGLRGNVVAGAPRPNGEAVDAERPGLVPTLLRGHEERGEEEPLVWGEVAFGEGDVAFSDATLTVRLDDVSLADAPSETLAEQVIAGVAWQPGPPASVPFALHGPPPDERARCSVSAHLDVDGDGQVSRGDYLNMESYPVLTGGYPRRVTVRLRRIR